MQIRHYHHLYLDGDAEWTSIASEFADSLRIARFPARPAIGIVGADRESAKRWLDEHIPGWKLAAEAEAGYEQVTLSALQRDLPGMEPDTAVLYTHSKGTWRNMPLEDQWRRSMLWHLVFCWPKCVSLLARFQTAGCHWRDDTHYAGNFWWARADYLRKLPPVTGSTEAERGKAEMWLGLGTPVAANLAEGFPPEGTEEGATQASKLLPPRHVQHRHVRPASEADTSRQGSGPIGIPSDLGSPPPQASIPTGWARRL